MSDKKRTIIVIDWSKKKGHGTITEVKLSGDKLPKDVLTTVINTLLLDKIKLKVRIF